MKKLLFLVLLSLILPPTLALADSDENVERRRPERPGIQEIRTERQELRSTVAENHANRLERRFTLYYTRLSNIITRFQARLDTLKTAGKDTTAAQAKLDLAKTRLEEAKAKGDAAVAAFKAIDPAKFSEQRTQAFAARDLAMEARKLFQETHTLLKDALKELKKISKPALPAASSAVENSDK